VLLGSDYPYDMGTLECARQVKALSISDGDKAIILGGQFLSLAGAKDASRKRQAHA
jgi:aminocarboxymuconate-semialdehyde decarboxylase